MGRLCDAEEDGLLVIDLQASLIPTLARAESCLARCQFLLYAAVELGVPCLLSEQVPSKLGPTDPKIEAASACTPVAKSTFSCWREPALRKAIEATRRKRWVLIGAETHICVAATALDLIDAGYLVTVCPDAVTARTEERHKLGMERLRDHGAKPAHTESVVYEWTKDASNPAFRTVLSLVKQFA